MPKRITKARIACLDLNLGRLKLGQVPRPPLLATFFPTIFRTQRSEYISAYIMFIHCECDDADALYRA
jgi:hypothetical protein